MNDAHARVLMIDNYDSFTYNLVQIMRALGASVEVKRNDEITPAQARAGTYTHLVISPGPGCPDEAGVSKAMIESLAGELPILGVCLGHQAMAEVFGGKVGRARCLMHGKASRITHDSSGVFAGVASPMLVGRYHSLVAFEGTLPKELIVTAQTIPDERTGETREIMGLRHATLNVQGVQFHPESVLTPMGPLLLANFLGVDRSAAERVVLIDGPSDALTPMGEGSVA